MAPPGTIRLLEVEPDLGTGLDADGWSRAMEEGVFPSARLASGALTAGCGPTAPILLVEGFLAREVRLAGRWAGQILGPGDVVDLAHNQADLPCEARWTVLAPASGAVLGDGFARWCSHRAPINVALMRRLGDQAARALVVAAVTGLPRVEQRVVAMLWILAGRWGTMTSAGAVVPVPLTHETLGRLIAARRSTVTLALGHLAEDGIVRRGDGGRFVLTPGSDAGLESLRGIERRPAVTGVTQPAGRGRRLESNMAVIQHS